MDGRPQPLAPAPARAGPGLTGAPGAGAISDSRAGSL